MSTAFQQSVWEALKRIPKGKVTTYAALAHSINTKAVRAVGSAIAKNPDAPSVPCHRVVRSDGAVGEYSAGGGKKRKIAMLRQEGVKIQDGKVVTLEDFFFQFPQTH